MTEHNREKLREVYIVLRPVVLDILLEMERAGFVPHITDAWRSQEAQAALYAAGHTPYVWSFHNAAEKVKPGIANKYGRPEALAVDIAGDGSTAFYLRLGAAARAQGLGWGGTWRLRPRERDIVYAAMDAKEWGANVRLGTDPQHIEVAGITLEQARDGVRPHAIK